MKMQFCYETFGDSWRVLQLLKEDFHQQHISFAFQNCLARPEYHWLW